MDLSEHTVLVTGASRGIGRELALQLARSGAKIIALARDEQALHSLASQMPGPVEIIVADLEDTEAIAPLARSLKTDHSDLSIVINNAALMAYQDLFADPPEKSVLTANLEIQLNYLAPVALSIHLLDHLASKPEAAIVNVSTGLALAPKQAAPGYCASKAALRLFTRSLRDQCVEKAPNLTITDAVMTLVDTKLSRRSHGSKISPAQAAAEVLQGMKNKRDEIWVGKTKLLRIIHRISPDLAYRILRKS